MMQELHRLPWSRLGSDAKTSIAPSTHRSPGERPEAFTYCNVFKFVNFDIHRDIQEYIGILDNRS